MNEHPKAFIALQLAKKPVLIVNSDNLHAMREGLLAMQKDFKALLKEQEAAEARHAAELREQAERFSEATSLTLRMLTPYPLARDEAEDILIPFILPKPDPLFGKDA